MANFILFIREDLTRYPMPDEELKAIIAKHSGWARNLAERGIFVDGNGIAETGYIVEKTGEELTVGPLQDLATGIGGYYIITAENMDAAIAIAKECPTFEYDKIEVRQLM